MNVAHMKNDRLANNMSERPKALREKADKTFYLGYDFMNKNNPSFHHEEFYSFDAVKTPRSTPMINNISLVVSLLRIFLLENYWGTFMN